MSDEDRHKHYRISHPSKIDCSEFVVDIHEEEYNTGLMEHSQIELAAQPPSHEMAYLQIALNVLVWCLSTLDHGDVGAHLRSP